VNYSKSKEAAEDLVTRLRENGSPDAIALQADVSDAAQAAELIEETVRHFGRKDMLVNNAGINIDRTMKNLSIDDWDKVIQVDLDAYFYTAKAGIIWFTRSAALELARYNVTANVVAPGYTRSEMYESIPEKTMEGILAQIPLGRVCEPEEVARAVRYLIVDGDYITGTTLNISGGIYLQ